MNPTVTVAYVFERYPVLSQTFLRREINGLTASGVKVEIYSMLPAKDEGIAPLPGVTVNYFRWWEGLKLLTALPREWWRDPWLPVDGWQVWREGRPVGDENFWATVWAVIFAVCRAAEFRRRRPDVLHGVRATGPATAVAVLSRLCGIPFSFGAHAYDIYRHGGDAFLEAKLREAALVHISTEAAKNYLDGRVSGAGRKIILARRGLEKLPTVRERSAAGRAIRLLAVGRLVAKKGHTEQLAVCARLKELKVAFEMRIVGEGKLRDELRAKIEELGLRKEITLCGAVEEPGMTAQYEWADIFWHGGIVDTDGDRDGLPNVIPEAMAHGLPVVTTSLPGAMEAVTNSVTGLVMESGERELMTEAVKRLAENAEMRREFGKNGRRWVEENFLSAVNAGILARRFEGISAGWF